MGCSVATFCGRACYYFRADIGLSADLSRFILYACPVGYVAIGWRSDQKKIGMFEDAIWMERSRLSMSNFGCWIKTALSSIVRTIGHRPEDFAIALAGYADRVGRVAVRAGFQRCDRFCRWTQGHFYGYRQSVRATVRYPVGKPSRSEAERAAPQDAAYGFSG